MEVHFRMGHIDLQNLKGFDVIVCPTDRSCSGSGGLDAKIHQAAGPDLKAALPKKKLYLAEVHMTEGFQLDVDHIAHVAVPVRDELTEEHNVLAQCYHNVLMTLGRTDIGGQHPETAVMSLLGTGSAGWSYEYSLSGLWRAVITYHREYHSHGSLKHLYVYYPGDIQASLLERYTRRASQAFFARPEEWGVRLGSGLWYALMEHFDHVSFNHLPMKDFIREIQRFFQRKTGTWLCGDTQVSVPEWAKFCSGVITPQFANLAIPVLCSNLCKLGFPANRDAVNFVLPVTLGEYSLTLPYEILPELTDLRKSALELTERKRILLVPGQPYYLTVFHYKNAPDLVRDYSLDAEEANDSHYRFSVKAAAELSSQLGYAPKAIGAALCGYLKEHGGAALEAMVRKYASEEFHY